MAHDHDIREPKRFEVPKNFERACLVFTAIGFATFAGALLLGDTHIKHLAWNGYLIGFWFTLSLALSGPFIVATQHLSIAGWSASIRRIPEAFGAFLAPALLFAVGGIFGASKLYHWWDVEYVMNDPILAKKADFLSHEWFIGATLVAMVAFNACYFWMRSVSKKQDEDGDYARTNLSKAISAIFLFVFVTGFSVMSWHWIMGLEPHWFSTMFSVYAFAGLFQSGLALTVIILLWLKDRDYFGDVVGTRQVHDLGQLLFGFTVFYAYIAFSQFLLIWYANIPEEGIWYVARGVAPEISTGWGAATLALPFIKFILPFLILLPQNNKKNQYNVLRYVAYWIFCVQLFEVWYWVAPTSHSDALAATPEPPVLELLISLGFLGVFGYFVSRALASANLVPTKDPFLHESIEHHHHGAKPPKPDDMKIS